MLVASVVGICYSYAAVVPVLFGKRIQQSQGPTSSSLHPKKKKPIPPTPLENVMLYILDHHDGNPEAAKLDLACIPTTYERYGEVLVIPPTSQPFSQPFSPLVGSALCKFLKVTCIVSQSRSGGELRTPTNTHILYRSHPDASTVAVHNEHGVQYRFDVLKIMWSSGNVKERSLFGKVITAPDEIVVDMFAGIGYFSLPLACAPNPADQPSLLVCIEKNPDSYQYLVQNMEHQGKKCAPNVLLCGDNTEVGNEFLHCCDRILMGYLPDTEKFIPRAVEFARKGKPVLVHFHFLQGSHEDGRLVAARHFTEQFQNSTLTADGKGVFEVREVRKIKSYAPKILHSVADVVMTIS
eukprot:PhF_6_TR26979/c0_g1_i2/m.39371/K07055/TRM12, TYW2; tRNA wybutosine-synthesizing protein 2